MTMRRIDLFDIVTAVMLVLTMAVLTLSVVAELQHSALEEQRQTIERQMATIVEQDSIMSELCFQRDSLQIIVGVDND